MSSENTIPKYLAQLKTNPKTLFETQDVDDELDPYPYVTEQVFEDPGTDDDEPVYETVGSDASAGADARVVDEDGTLDASVDAASLGADITGAGATESQTDDKKWIKVQTRKKKFWDPVLDRPTSRRRDGKGPDRAMMCPNRFAPGGCKTMLPCACGRVGHTAKHNNFRTYSRSMFMVNVQL